MILVVNRYFARPGAAESVLATRWRASARLAELGLPVGQIFVRARASDAGPDVIWQCTYASPAERRLVTDRLSADAAFEAIRAEQASQLARFEREVFELDEI